MFSTPHRLHPAAIIISFGRSLVATVRTLFIPALALIFANRRTGVEYVTLLDGALVGLVGLVTLGGPIIEYLTTTFWIDGDALVIKRGLLFHSRRTIPLARIQNVNVERTLWHRLLNAASVKVETASGHAGEGKLTALSLDDANNLQAVLLHGADGEVSKPSTAAPEPLYSLSFSQVLLAGALENRALYIFFTLLGTLQLDRARVFIEPLARSAGHLGPQMTALLGALFVIGLIVLGWLFSIVISAARFYGFRIERHERGLLLVHGLVTQFRSIVPVGRIQEVRVIQPVLFRLLGYSQVFADTAGSFGKQDLASANKIYPLVAERGVGAIGRLLLPEFEFEELAWQPVSAWTVWRQSLRYFFLWMLLLGGALFSFLHWRVMWVAVPVVPLSAFIGYLHFRIVGYAFTPDLVAARSGVFRRQTTLAPFDRLQHYTITSTPFQRQVGVATVRAVTAASGHHAIHIEDVDARSADAIRETLRSSIRRHLGSRRAGL